MRTDGKIAGSKIVAIASSTGGPKALQRVIAKLPANLTSPVLIVQHMPAGFTEALACRLNNLSELAVKEAADGDIISPGNVYLARGGMHMEVLTKSNGQHVIRYSDKPPREGVKPCANYMYESLADSKFDEVVCVVMTGMGADGTEGISNLKLKKKVTVFSQNEETCTVYGMPRSIMHAGLSQKELPLEELANEIIKNVGVK